MIILGHLFLSCDALVSGHMIDKCGSGECIVLSRGVRNNRSMLVQRPEQGGTNQNARRHTAPEELINAYRQQEETYGHSNASSKVDKILLLLSWLVH